MILQSWHNKNRGESSGLSLFFGIFVRTQLIFMQKIWKMLDFAVTLHREKEEISDLRKVLDTPQ